MNNNCGGFQSSLPLASCTHFIKKQRMGVLTKIKKKQFGALIKRKNKKEEKRQSCFLKVVHPHGYTELFRQAITAAEIMKRYPKHFVARTDFFENPWIVVRPQSVLLPGEMFFLVSLKTVERTLKEKGEQEGALNLEKCHERSYSRISIHDHDHHDNHDNEASSSNGRVGHDSDDERFYRPSFYESWNEMQRRIQQLDQDSPLFSGRPHVESPERDELQRVTSCLRRPDSDRRNLDLKVTFASPVVVRSVRLDDLNFYVWTHDH